MGERDGMGCGYEGTAQAATGRARMRLAPVPQGSGRGADRRTSGHAMGSNGYARHCRPSQARYSHPSHVRYCHPSHATGLNGRGGVRRGFTLAELMVSVAVLLILMTMVGWIFSTATRASGVATANNELMGLTRAAKDQLASDLNSRIATDLTGKSTFMAIWYQLTPDPRYAGRYLRTDRIVFYTQSAGMLKQDDPANMKISGAARVFYGHENGIFNQPDVEKWILARRAKVQAPTYYSTTAPYPGVAFSLPPDGIDASFKASGYVDRSKLWDGVSDLCDNWECEPYSLESWGTMPLNWIFTPNSTSSNLHLRGLMVDNATTATESWIRRPVVNTSPDYTRQAGLQMCFLPGCAEFKVQRWVERDPVTGASLGMGARWYPEEDVDGNGLVENTTGVNDFFDMQPAMNASVPTVVREYYGGPPLTSAVSPLTVTPLMPPSGTMALNCPDGRWLHYTDDVAPKAIKITIRLFDPNKRIPDGQILTMTFGVPGLAGD